MNKQMKPIIKPCFIKLNLRRSTKLDVSSGGAVYLAGVMEYMIAEMMDLAGGQATNFKIKPCDILASVRHDKELDELLLKHVTSDSSASVTNLSVEDIVQHISNWFYK